MGTIAIDGPSRMVKRPTGSGGEPSSPNCGASAGVKARHLLLDTHPTDRSTRLNGLHVDLANSASNISDARKTIVLLVIQAPCAQARAYRCAANGIRRALA